MTKIMSREIKFRAWDKEGKRWYTGDFYVQESKVYIFDDDGGCGDPECCGDTGYYMSRMDDLIPVQYIGLTDKNGVEIYEGYIVRFVRPNWDWDDGGSFDRVTVEEVRWDSEEAEFDANHYREDVFHVPWGDMEVIGNIYENPELLE